MSEWFSRWELDQAHLEREEARYWRRKHRMTDTAQLNLKEPVQTDWDNAYSTSKYVAPPPALGPDGKPIVYSGVIKEAKLTDADEGYLNYQLDILIDGGARSRVWASVKPFTKLNKSTGEREPMAGNPNKLGSIFKAAGVTAKPQTNSDYQATVRSILNRKVRFTLDWEARNKDTGEVVKGFNAFPVDPATGSRRPILKAGDTINTVDEKGQATGTTTVKSEVLFANARVKYFQDAQKAGV